MRYVDRASEAPHIAHADAGREERAHGDDHHPLASREEADCAAAPEAREASGGRQLLKDQHRRRMHHELQPHDVHRKIEERIARERDQRRGDDEWDVHHEKVLEAQPQVPEQLASFRDRSDDGAEVVVEEDDRGDLARAARPALSHRDADVRRLQRRYVVHAVARHGDDLACRLELAHQRELLRG